MTPTPFAVLFRTHFWDAFAQRQFDRVLAHASGCDVYILLDETNGPVEGIAHDLVVRHTEADILAMGFPRAGQGNMLWFNGDYPLYFFLGRHAQYSHILQLEYDVSVNTDIGAMLSRMRAEHIDFIGLSKGELPAEWPWLETCLDLYSAANLRHQLICLSAFSAASLHYLWSQRLSHANKLAQGAISAWPMCEAFIATELAEAGFKIAELTEFGDADTYDHWPPFLETDLPSLADHSFIHPLLDEPRFIGSMLKYHVGLTGYLFPLSLFHRKLRRLPAPVYVRTLITTFAAKAERTIRRFFGPNAIRGKAA